MLRALTKSSDSVRSWAWKLRYSALSQTAGVARGSLAGKAAAIKKLLEGEEVLDGGFGFGGLGTVAYFVVVDREIPEDFGGVQLQLGQKFFELGLIEEFALLDGPGVAKELFRSEGQAGDDHGGETEGFAFVDANIVGNGMGPIVVGGRGIDFGLPVAANAIIFAHAVPGGFDS